MFGLKKWFLEARARKIARDLDSVSLYKGQFRDVADAFIAETIDERERAIDMLLRGRGVERQYDDVDRDLSKILELGLMRRICTLYESDPDKARDLVRRIPRVDLYSTERRAHQVDPALF